MAKTKNTIPTEADKQEFIVYFIELLDRGVNDEYYFSEGQSNVLESLGFSLPTSIMFSTNGVHTHTIKLYVDEEEEQ